MTTLILFPPDGIAAAFAAVLGLAFIVAGYLLLLRSGGLARAAGGVLCLAAGTGLFSLVGIGSAQSHDALVVLLWVRCLLGGAALLVLLWMAVIKRWWRRPGAPVIAAVLIATALLAPGAALAADGGTSVDLTPLIGAGLTLLSGGLAVLTRTAVRAVVTYLEHKTRLELDEHTRDYLDQALERAVAWGTAKAEQRLDAAAPAIDLHNEAVAKAAQYAMARVPDALAHFGITGPALESMIEARMVTLFGEPVSSVLVSEPADAGSTN